MSFLTLEPGGANPPSDVQKSNIRLALGMRGVPGDKDFATYVAADSPVSMTIDGKVIFINASAGDVIVRLPPISATEMQTVVFKRVDDTGNTATISPAAVDVGVLVDGAASVSLAPLASATTSSDTSNWWITAISISNPIGLTP